MTITAPQPVETTTQSPLGEAVPVTRHRFTPSPLNRRRWQNFKANRRGYWSLWIFLILFVVSLFAELIANDRPFLVKYDGHLYWPAFFSYSETTFGGDFETAADYRDPYLQKQIADKGGTIVWPLIRTYDTHTSTCRRRRLEADRMLTEQQCSETVQKKRLSGRRDLEYNWLVPTTRPRRGRPPDLRIPRLGIVRSDADDRPRSSVLPRAACRAISAAGSIAVSALHRGLERDPLLYLLLIISAVLPPGFFVLLGILLLFSWRRWWGWCAPSFCAAFEYIMAARTRRSTVMCSAICCRTRWWRP